MAKTFQQLEALAKLIINENQDGKNDGTRVGGSDLAIIEKLEEVDNKIPNKDHFIPLSGTEKNKPVAGNIEFQPGKEIRSTDDSSAIKFSSDGKQAQYKNSEIANKQDLTDFASKQDLQTTTSKVDSHINNPNIHIITSLGGQNTDNIPDGDYRYTLGNTNYRLIQVSHNQGGNTWKNQLMITPQSLQYRTFAPPSGWSEWKELGAEIDLSDLATKNDLNTISNNLIAHTQNKKTHFITLPLNANIDDLENGSYVREYDDPTVGFALIFVTSEYYGNTYQTQLQLLGTGGVIKRKRIKTGSTWGAWGNWEPIAPEIDLSNFATIDDLNTTNQNLTTHIDKTEFDSKLTITDSDGVETTFGLLKLGEKIPLKLRISDILNHCTDEILITIGNNALLWIYDFHWNDVNREECTLTSSNPNIATIDEFGVITGISAGKTTFKAVRNSDGAIGETDLIITVDNLKLSVHESPEFDTPELDYIPFEGTVYLQIKDENDNSVNPLDCTLTLTEKYESEEADISSGNIDENGVITLNWMTWGGGTSVIIKAFRHTGGYEMGTLTVLVI